LKYKAEIQKHYYDRNAKDRNVNVIPNSTIVFRENNIWKSAKVLKRHNTPRSIIIKDQNNRIKRKNEVDIKISRTAQDMNKIDCNKFNRIKPNFKNKYWANKKIIVAGKENRDEEETRKIGEDNSLEQNSGMERTVSKGEYAGYHINKYGRKTKIINYKK